jgi:hypothetical protein
MASGIVWPSLDLGITSVPYAEASYLAARTLRDKFQINLAKKILNVPRFTSSDGVLGELGWSTNIERNDLQLLLFLSRALHAPSNNVNNRLMFALASAAGLAPNDAPPFIRRCQSLLHALNISMTQIVHSTKDATKLKLKRAMAVYASEACMR